MIKLFILLYLVIGLVVGTFVFYNEIATETTFESFVRWLDTGDAWTILLMSIVWPVLLFLFVTPHIFIGLLKLVLNIIDHKK